ncbi:deoxynucleoside kinase [Candidatus Daviesbacteria bacterium]|nr:deoxynucleoside kinase [Candidatus Daviesbacteria bacterium]
MNNQSPFLIVLTGKTASGKDTVMAKLMNTLPNLKKVVTTTSRKPRSNEKNGVDYYFISEAEFRQKINQEDFIEYVSYGGNLYGTEKKQITDNLDKNLIWRIDPSRAGQIKEFMEDSDFKLTQNLLKRTAVIYLTTSDEVVLERLKRRGLTKQEIETRMGEDQRFWKQFKDNYNFVVENTPGKLNETVAKIIQIIYFLAKDCNLK